MLLPNNSNVVMSAEQAARVAGKPVHVVPTTSIPAGLAALVAFHDERSADENATAMREALAGVVTGEIAVASRDASTNGVAVRRASSWRCWTVMPSPRAPGSTRSHVSCSNVCWPSRGTCSRCCAARARRR